MAENPNVDDLKTPLLAAIGAVDLALATVSDLVASLRDRADETRGNASSRIEESRGRLNRLQDELPGQVADLRERLTSEELRKAAEGYVEAATTRYHDLAVRGEAALERLRGQSRIERRAERYAERAEGYFEQAVERTQDVLGNVASQTREVGERAAGLVGIEVPKKNDADTDTPKAAPTNTDSTTTPPKKAPATKAPAKKTAANKVTQK